MAGAGAAAAQEATASSRPLAGKTAIVTGARANMGRAFSVALAEMGADVVVHYHRAETVGEAEETARFVRAAGSRAVLSVGDLGQPETARAMFDAAEREFGGADILVNNAGAIIKKPVAEFTDEEFDRLDSANGRGLFFALREGARRLRDGGRIINNATSLLAGAAPGYAIYAGTKAPVEEYTRMMAKELGDRMITVNAIAPGPVDTPFFHGAETPQSVAYAAGLSVEGRLGKVDDIVPLVRFLASPDSQWVNGQTMWVNGGYLTR
ncbi:SDR family oxidoreductase [Pontivivens ytuae]|uniref:SDR family oxidoreductase n=2 Tax=Pontivivens ytuae TaxID=2789856 RepID=A0A7S9LVL7_9RHOB|nr:SDR family oxidoreductase [Pontivivens ytuae]